MARGRAFRLALVVTTATVFPFALAAAQDVGKKIPTFERQYGEVLDAFFEHVRGVSETAIILRVWGGLSPEYEIVLDPEITPKSLDIWTAAKPIWGNAYGLSGARPATDESIALARKIGASKTKVAVPEEQLRELWRRALVVDTSLSEDRPFRDSQGRQVVLLDVPYLEMIIHGGRTRVRVTDTSGSDVVSENPLLLRWAIDLEQAAGGKKISP